MDKKTITALHSEFEKYSYEDDGVEFWFARDLQKLLGYEKWENFTQAVTRAKTACLQSGHGVEDHFPDVRKMVDVGSGAKREITDIMLTRYACYLIAQNGDPRKEEIAFAQSYFAIQTRKQELIEQRIALAERLQARKRLVASETELSKLIYERGVDEDGFARIRSKGDQALFGGRTTIQMKRRLSMPKNRPIADFLPTVTIAAKNLATEITNFAVKKEDLAGERDITRTHVKNNTRVRELLLESDITPENLPPEEDLKKLQHQVAKEEKQIADSSKTAAENKISKGMNLPLDLRPRNTDKCRMRLLEGMAVSLSKSKYISGLQCPKLLWHLYNKPEALPAADEATQAMFDQGHDIGDYAKKLYPTGIEVAWGRGFSYTLTRTRELLGIKRPIFEGSFSFGNVYARADLLVPVDGGWELIEVKSSTEVKDVHIEDVALQLFVLQGCAVPIVRCSVMTVDTTYVRDGAIDATRLLKSEDVTARVLAVLPLVGERVASMLALIAAECPTVKIGPQCNSPYECALTSVCWSYLPPHNVTELYYAGKKAFPILDTYTLIADVPLELLSEKQKTQQDAIVAGHAIVDKTAIASWLSRLTYPLYLLDFETINPAVPLWDGTRPYQQVPFQLSLHIIDTPEALAAFSDADHNALPQQTEPAQQATTLPPCDIADGATATSVNVSQNTWDTGEAPIHAGASTKMREGRLGFAEAQPRSERSERQRAYERAAAQSAPEDNGDGREVDPEKSAEGAGATQGGTADAQGAKGIRHVEFLAQDTTDPRAAVAAALHAIGPTGTVLAYNASFEKRVIKELAELFPDEKTFLLDIDARMEDLLIPFKNFWYYHPAQHGSCSIKAVLPAMTGRSYAGLEVADGGAAQRAWMAATFGALPAEERSRLFTSLLAYCKQDTEAMGEVLRGLKTATKH